MNKWMNESINQSINDQHSALGKLWQIKPDVLGEGVTQPAWPCLPQIWNVTVWDRHGLSVTDWCLTTSRTSQKSEWALMSPLNFYCIPPPSTAIMLHSRHSKHCNTVPVQSQHTAHSVKCGYWIWTHRKCANNGVITETYNIAAAVAGTYYTAVVTTVTIIATDLRTIQLWLPLSPS
jgi:hypothetical protein